GVALRARGGLGESDVRAVRIDLIVGRDNPHRVMIAALARFIPDTALYVQPSNLADIMACAQLALGAGGATSWERCCLGVPTALISIAENQKGGCRALAAARAGVYLGDIAEVR